jgi:hypothetical protein
MTTDANKITGGGSMEILVRKDLLEKAMEAAKLDSKEETIEQALDLLIWQRTRKDLNEIFGKFQLADDYDYKAARGKAD